MVATHSERMVTCGGVCAKTFSVEGPSGGHCGRLVTNTAGSKTWVCKECLNFRKRKHLPNHEDSDLENQPWRADGDAQQEIQMGLVVRTADPTLLGVDGMQDTMISCEALRSIA